MLKEFAKSNLRSFKIEEEVLLKLKKANLCKNGFPAIYSSKETEEKAEILMESLG